jgi:acetyl-CoA decarbonylase/synthase complex subunit epsilon
VSLIAEPWQRAEVAGTKKALIINKPEIVAAMIKRAKRPILVVGHQVVETELSEGEKAIDRIIELAKTAEIPVVATAHIIKEFLNRGFNPSSHMSIMEIGSRLQAPDWTGLDGKGAYDLAIFVGIPYYMEWVILTGLKNFAQNLKTISLDRFYQPHANWSFPNLPLQKWDEQLKLITNLLKEREEGTA